MTHPFSKALAKSLVFLFIASQGITSAWAQTQEPWTIQRCIAYALDNNLDLQLSEMDIDINEANLIQSRHARYPDLNGFASNNYNWGRSFDVFTNDAVDQRVRSNNFGLNSSMTVFNGFRITNTIKQNDMILEASKLDLEDTKNNITLNLLSAYLQILFNQENLENAQRQLDNSDEQISRTSKLVDAGRLPESNLLDLLSQRATDELQVVNAQNALALSTLQLKQLLQIPDEEPFEIVVPEIPEPTEAAVQNSETIYETALTTQPNIKSADLNVEISNLGIDIAKSNYYPTLSLNAGLNTFYSSAQEVQRDVQVLGTETVQVGYAEVPDPETGNIVTIPIFRDGVPVTETTFRDFGFWDQMDESFRRNIGLSLRIPIYNRHQARTAVTTAQIRSEQARINAKLIKNQLRQTIETSRQDVIAAEQSYDANSRREAALQETFRMTEQQYNLGAANITDLTVARNNLVNAQSDLIRAKYDFVFKRKILDFYLGKEIKF